MKATFLLRTLVLCTASFGTSHLSATETAIASFSASNIDFYEAPELTAKNKKIEVPQGKPGNQWMVLDSQKRFYKIQAGPHGVGWALRSNITVDPNSPMVEPSCSRKVATGQTSKQITGGVAGAAGSSGC